MNRTPGGANRPTLTPEPQAAGAVGVGQTVGEGAACGAVRREAGPDGETNGRPGVDLRADGDAANGGTATGSAANGSAAKRSAANGGTAKRSSSKGGSAQGSTANGNAIGRGAAGGSAGGGAAGGRAAVRAAAADPATLRQAPTSRAATGAAADSDAGPDGTEIQEPAAARPAGTRPADARPTETRPAGAGPASGGAGDHGPASGGAADGGATSSATSISVASIGKAAIRAASNKTASVREAPTGRTVLSPTAAGAASIGGAADGGAANHGADDTVATRGARTAAPTDGRAVEPVSADVLASSSGHTAAPGKFRPGKPVPPNTSASSKGHTTAPTKTRPDEPPAADAPAPNRSRPAARRPTPQPTVRATTAPDLRDHGTRAAAVDPPLATHQRGPTTAAAPAPAPVTTDDAPSTAHPSAPAAGSAANATNATNATDAPTPTLNPPLPAPTPAADPTPTTAADPDPDPTPLSPAILAIHTVLPEHRYPQDTLTDLIADMCLPPGADQRALRRLHASSTVQARHLALPIEQYARLDDFGRSNDAWIGAAVELGEEAVAGALAQAGLRPDEVDLVACVSVTGLAVPSVDARLALRMGMRQDVKRLPLFGLGCVAGAAGLARVHDFLRGHPTGVAVLLAVELCSLTLQRGDDSAANLVAGALFGDGAGAVVAVGSAHPKAQRTPDRSGSRDSAGAATPATTPTTTPKPHRRTHGPRIIATRSTLYPETEHVLGWEVGASGFRVVLTADVPDLVRAHLRHEVCGFLGEHGLVLGDISAWVCHPGGPKVVEAVGESLGLAEGALEPTWRSLAAVGNLSSASVLHILQSVEESARPAPGSWGVMLALGPGFCSELVLLRW